MSDKPMTRAEFAIGDRARVTVDGQAAGIGSWRCRKTFTTGTVTRVAEDPACVTVLPDGRTHSRPFHRSYWEQEPRK